MDGYRSDAEIRYDYQIAKEYADRLTELANEIKQIANSRYTDSINQISLKWQGESANVFKSKAEKVKSDMLKTANDIDQAAEKLMSTAVNLYRTEMTAKEIAEKRSY